MLKYLSTEAIFALLFDRLRESPENAKKAEKGGGSAQIYNLLYIKDLYESQKIKCPKSPPYFEECAGDPRKCLSAAPVHRGKNGVEFET